MLKKLLWPLLLILGSCIGGANNSSDNVLARVGNEYLQESELEGIAPSGIPVKDSIQIIQSYVNSWVSQRLFLQKAIKNLRQKDMGFEKQLEEYRNSLIIYTYESALVKQRIDTVVSEDEIEAYYNDNQANFQLKNNIVRVYYARFDDDFPELKKFRNFFYSDKQDHRDSAEYYIENYSNLYFLNDETWVLFSDVLRFVPIETFNQESFLRNNLKTNFKQENFIYFICFSDFRIKDGVSPLSFERENIQKIILNKRRLTIINEMREEVFNAALERNEFEIY